jgi:hypothetical protein
VPVQGVGAGATWRTRGGSQTAETHKRTGVRKTPPPAPDGNQRGLHDTRPRVKLAPTPVRRKITRLAGNVEAGEERRRPKCESEEKRTRRNYMYRGYLPCSSSSGRHREIRVAQFASKRSPPENHRNGSRYLVPAATITQGPGCVLNGFHRRKALDMWQKLRHGNSQKFGSPVRQSLPPCSGPPTTPNHRTPEERGFRNDPLLAPDPKNPPKIVVQ